MRLHLLAGLALLVCVPVHAAEPAGTIDASVLSKPPRLVREAAPEFPAAAREQHVGAEIKLQLDLDDKGQVSGAVVVEPAEPTGLGFEDAALTAAYQLVFEPAEIEGKPVAVQITYTFKFLAPPPEPPPPPAPPEPTPVPVKNFAGMLRERGTRVPLGGALVTVYQDEGRGYECLSDAQGRFQFYDLVPGTWQVTVEADGYRPFHTSEEMRAGELTEARYFVERTSYNPFDIVVESPRPRKEVTRVVVDRATIEQVPGAMGDALTALQNFAGVARVPAMQGDIIVRGSAPHDTRVFVEGIEIPIAYHFGGMRSVLPTGMIAALDFYPGNFSPSYGRATGGVIDVKLRRPLDPRWNGYVDINLLDSGFFLEAPVGDKLTLSAAARRSYVDMVLDAVLPDSVPMRLVQPPVYYDYQLLADYRPTPAHHARLFFFGSSDRLAMIFKNPAELGSDLSGNEIGNRTRFQRLVASHSYVPGERLETTLSLALGRDRFDQILAQYAQHMMTDSIQLRDTTRLRPWRSLTLTLGLDALLQHWTADVRMPMPPQEGREDAVVDRNRAIETTTRENHWLPGAFAEADIQVTPTLLLSPGVRADYFSKIDQATVGPRLSARLGRTGATTLKGAVGIYHQEPSVDQSNKDFGNPLLKAERAIHTSLGLEWNPWPTLSTDITGFYKHLDSLVSETSSTRVENGQEIPLRYDNQGRGRVFGMEVVVRRDPRHRLSGWLAYTLSRSQRLDSGATSYRLFQHDQTHILTAVAMLRLPGNWQIGSRFRLVSGKPATPVVGAVNDLDIDRYRPIYGARYSERNPMFIQWDVRIDKKWVFNRFLLNAYLDVQNVTNRTNIEAPDYNWDYSRKKTETGMPIYPILGLRAEF